MGQHAPQLPDCERRVVVLQSGVEPILRIRGYKLDDMDCDRGDQDRQHQRREGEDQIVPVAVGEPALTAVEEHGPGRVGNRFSEGDEVLVKCIGIDKQGKIKLSRKEALGQKLPEDN